MPANPMQKKTRNAFILGMLLTIIIVAIIGGLGYYFLVFQKNKVKEAQGDVLTYVFRLKNDVNALSEITLADVESIAISSKVVPADAFQSKTKTVDSKGKETWIDGYFPSGKFAKVSLKAGTIVGSSMLTGPDLSYFEIDKDTKEVTIKSDIRRVEYNMITLGTDVTLGDFVDIRIALPNGQDMIIVSKKEIKSLLGNTVGFDMSEGEIELMQSAIVESYIIKASKIYLTKYIDAGMQKTIAKSYSPTKEVQELMEKNSDVISDALRYFDEAVRGNIDSQKNRYSETRQQNLEEGVKTEITNAQKAREAYLTGLDTY